MKLTRYRAAWHEVRCVECRVTWRSWVQRIVGDKRGFVPHLPPSQKRHIDGTVGGPC